MSASSSFTLVELKKLVGGICFGSPTTITDLPRAMAPIASLVGICEASSNTMRSNLSCERSMYCATDIGLISIHLHNRGMSVGNWSIRSRIETPRPPFDMFRCSKPISLLLSMLLLTCGICDAICA